MRTRGFGLGLGAALALGLTLASTAGAATIRVETKADEFNLGNPRCSLREAIYVSDTDAAGTSCTTASGNDTVAVPKGTYNLTIQPSGPNDIETGDLNVEDISTIRNAKAGDKVIIDQKANGRVFRLDGNGVELRNLTIRGGFGTQGAGVNAEANPVTLRGVTVSGNSTNPGTSEGGGVAVAGGVLNIVNSTISGNTGAQGGGLAVLGGVARLSNTTIANNTATGNFASDGGGGVFVNGGDDLEIENSLIAGNRDTNQGGNAPVDADCKGLVDAVGTNLIGVDSGGCIPDDPVLTGNAKLAPLADNGGPTRTHALRGGSKAINEGQQCFNVDQRSAPRKRCDLGSYERIVKRGIVINRVGTSGNDRIRGTNKKDGFLGRGGRDRLIGRGGKDFFDGGPGNDRCIGGPGNDIARRCEVEISL